LLLIGVYSALFMGRGCFKQADLAALRKDVLSIRYLWHQFSVISRHCSEVFILKYLSYVCTTMRSLRRFKGSTLVLISHDLVGVVLSLVLNLVQSM
jgi:hypothetical protein